jgi:hypothetical protein
MLPKFRQPLDGTQSGHVDLPGDVQRQKDASGRVTLARHHLTAETSRLFAARRNVFCDAIILY